ncbi:mucoidy inhibitor MuiA family protein [Flavobacterium rakeshii]|uniref:Mucoidy inhibitor MuiA family protein n=1 Tax=Flavobacterium rakeshii TaxID=1038845 RepID=A0A6N8HF01_9FLAO|nr:DUF4139 domain-containing protein [Flavobacterium rakeshii]MUV04288.1 mucoidy inhibitor MuiA family protein [Flavobacterium rakeshii]
MRALLIILLLAGNVMMAQKPVFTNAEAKSATVYFNGAELTHTANVKLPAGTSEIVIKNVADYLNESTVQIGAPSTLTVLSVQFTRNYISEYTPDETSPQVKQVRDSITLLTKELNRVKNAKTSEEKILELLDKNNQVYGQDSGLSVAELMKMVDYYKAKRTETANTINTLTGQERKITENITRLNRKLEVNTSKTEKDSQGKLVLQVMNETAGNVPLSISYLTPSATWSPFYDLRAESISEPINMMYKAQVTQQTGIDWKKIKLTLSSGQPNQNNEAPILSAWFLRFNDLRNYRSGDVSVMNSLKGQVAGLEISNGEASPTGDVVIRGYSSIDKYVAITENQLTVSFDIDVPYDILSNGKKHSVTLKEIKLPASYRHYAVPKLEKETFLLAEIEDYSKYNLLSGEANIIFEGMYAGKTYIDPNSTSDTLRLSMGRDKKVSVKREKVTDKSGSKFLSSYKEQTFTYDLTVKNNKKETVSLMLKDQYPISTDKDIQVELLESDGAKINKETGVLTWELKLKPGESKKLRISYKVRYPKDKPVYNL